MSRSLRCTIAHCSPVAPNGTSALHRQISPTPYPVTQCIAVHIENPHALFERHPSLQDRCLGNQNIHTLPLCSFVTIDIFPQSHSHKAISTQDYWSHIANREAYFSLKASSTSTPSTRNMDSHTNESSSFAANNEATERSSVATTLWYQASGGSETGLFDRYGANKGYETNEYQKVEPMKFSEG
jgi:hypothetical protein